MAIAEVVRDLHRNDDQREQSYSERQLYEAALERLTREVAAVAGSDEAGAQRRVGEVLVGRAA
jgi:CarD family transcriptional regulator